MTDTQIREAITLLFDLKEEMIGSEIDIYSNEKPTVEALETAISLARTVLAAGVEAPEEKAVCESCSDECENNKTEKERCIEAIGYNAYRQAVLPVVAKKNMIIAEQAKRIEVLERSLVQMVKYVREQHDNPKYTVSIYTPHLEDAEKIVAQMGDGVG